MIEWRRLKNFPDYEISSIGGCRRATPHPRSPDLFPVGYVLEPWRHSRGFYLCYTLRNGTQKNNKLAHNLVADEFLPPRPSKRHQLAHNDGNGKNNDYRNLRWALPSENQADRIIHGTSNIGERHGMSKLTWDDIFNIRALSKNGKSNTEIARKFGVGQPTISNIVNLKSWKFKPEENKDHLIKKLAT